MELNKNKVVVGMSGGVDSSLAAYLLKEEGYEVIGITMRLFDTYDKDDNLVYPDFIEEAKVVAKKLCIPHYVVDFREDFRKKVKNRFVNEYFKGRTPNPCVICNKWIKYGKLLEVAHRIGAYYLATGHYANVRYDEKSKKYRIFRGIAEKKDQSYFLHSLNQGQLKHVLFPLGKYSSKKEVRKIAKEIGARISKKKDSVGICFINNGDYASYLKAQDSSHTSTKSGNFIDIKGRIIGKHNGIINYTIGQRRGIDVESEKPMYVVEIDSEKNTVKLGEDKDTYSRGLIARDPNFTLFKNLESEMKVEVKVCQWGWFLAATLSQMDNSNIQVLFDKKERAIAPGQAVVFYKDTEVIGGATIEKVIK
ncbi:MAG: tRNA 2-thiouridine(34) synthase MnmA [Firmicutes bacterium]|nr:tRNA 2-thiouridine(34) synthase MnmA [Bacillota bacterium]